MKHFWMDCTLCQFRWIASFVMEHGGLEYADDTENGCPECGADPDLCEIGDEYQRGDLD